MRNHLFSMLLLAFFLLSVCADYEKAGQDGTRDEERKSKERTTSVVKTEIMYTTIIYSATPTIYSITEIAAPANQQQTSSPNSVGDPNNNNSNNSSAGLEQSLESDQQALKRMVTILSLVGGLGVIAIVATVVIFTRMRARSRKQRALMEDDQHESSTFELSLENHNNSTHRSDLNEQAMSTASITSSSNDQHHRQPIEPSAPPASLVHVAIEHPCIPDDPHPVQSTSLPLTTIPSPSAPTAKELDAIVDDSTVFGMHADSYGSNSIPSTSSHAHPAHSVCTRCSPMIMAPELPPPPAYTPSAPPHYALPIDPMSMHPPSRRHSLGS
ncbi:hypothetical protein A0J61_01668 [Choanephora cucurbitarum]|uniref:Mid2 domain-containing protein n=1 Tax=Choanephora cucurbitarum TaxID=101091 RepID=A0A1C7NSE6_9FUNG|nr:hypothetical protein A0J61_01668 [Choanephora cucurbitarum]